MGAQTPPCLLPPAKVDLSIPNRPRLKPSPDAVHTNFSDKLSNPGLSTSIYSYFPSTALRLVIGYKMAM